VVQNQQGQLLKGGMALSYGLPDTAQTIFDKLLSGESNENVRNRAWYYLAKLYHQRSKPIEAYAALEKIHGNIPLDLHLDYHYLATLVNSDGEHLNSIQQAIDQIPTTTPQYPYLVFNLGVSYLNNGNQTAAVNNLQTVVNYADGSEELQVLADRARHGLAQLAMQDQNLLQAWLQLRDIRTTGL
jgi:tetratricopeptide (TPR) repeat protein